MVRGVFWVFSMVGFSSYEYFFEGSSVEVTVGVFVDRFIF